MSPIFFLFLLHIIKYDAIEEIENSIPDDSIGIPNTLYDASESIISTLSSVSDTNTFCNRYNHNNGYNGLKIGQTIKINDGLYNMRWQIAGFDLEYKKYASDGTIRDNGYGICLVAMGGMGLVRWYNSTNGCDYYWSNCFDECETISSRISTILSTHLVTRNVLVGDSADSTGHTSYTWTTARATLLSVGQCNGILMKNNNKYDDGEANYKLPLFNYKDYWKADSDFWTRNLKSENQVWCVQAIGGVDSRPCTSDWVEMRPMIYIR